MVCVMVCVIYDVTGWDIHVITGIITYHYMLEILHGHVIQMIT